MPYELESIPEYLTLYGNDATVNSNRYKWSIPSAYYSNQRSSVCFVSLVDCIINDTTLDTEILVKYTGAQNGFSTKNDGTILGSLVINTDSGSHGHLRYQQTECIKLLVNARPSNIEIILTDVDNAVVEPDSITFVLKFEYLNAIDTVRTYEKTFTPQI